MSNQLKRIRVWKLEIKNNKLFVWIKQENYDNNSLVWKTDLEFMGDWKYITGPWINLTSKFENYLKKNKNIDLEADLNNFFKGYLSDLEDTSLTKQLEIYLNQLYGEDNIKNNALISERYEKVRKDTFSEMEKEFTEIKEVLMIIDNEKFENNLKELKPLLQIKSKNPKEFLLVTSISQLFDWDEAKGHMATYGAIWWFLTGFATMSYIAVTSPFVTEAMLAGWLWRGAVWGWLVSAGVWYSVYKVKSNYQKIKNFLSNLKYKKQLIELIDSHKTKVKQAKKLYYDLKLMKNLKEEFKEDLIENLTLPIKEENLLSELENLIKDLRYSLKEKEKVFKIMSTISFKEGKLDTEEELSDFLPIVKESVLKLESFSESLNSIQNILDSFLSMMNKELSSNKLEEKIEIEINSYKSIKSQTDLIKDIGDNSLKEKLEMNLNATRNDIYTLTFYKLFANGILDKKSFDKQEQLITVLELWKYKNELIQTVANLQNIMNSIRYESNKKISTYQLEQSKEILQSFV